jgi:hypothetical protein
MAEACMAIAQYIVAQKKHSLGKCPRRDRFAFDLKSRGYGAREMRWAATMGFRNYTARAVLLLVLALGVAITVAILSGSDGGRAIHGSNLPVLEDHAHQRVAKPTIWIGPRRS